MPQAQKPRRRGPYAKSAQRREDIIQAAFAVFAANGYRGGSLQGIADRVGLSQTALLHYFATKRDLLIAVLEHRDEVYDSRQLGDHLTFSEQILEQAHLNERVPGLIELYTVLAGESVTVGSPARDYFMKRVTTLRAEYTESFRKLEQRGRLRTGTHPENAASMLIALWDGLQTQWLLQPSLDVTAGLREYLELIILPETDAQPTAGSAVDRTGP